MSADTWETCPFCHNLPKADRDKIAHLYGKAPQKEYDRQKEEIEAQRDTKTIREDYDVHINSDGTVSIWFVAKCMACGASWEFIRRDIECSVCHTEPTM